MLKIGERPGLYSRPGYIRDRVVFDHLRYLIKKTVDFCDDWLSWLWTVKCTVERNLERTRVIITISKLINYRKLWKNKNADPWITVSIYYSVVVRSYEIEIEINSLFFGWKVWGWLGLAGRAWRSRPVMGTTCYRYRHRVSRNVKTTQGGALIHKKLKFEVGGYWDDLHRSK